MDKQLMTFIYIMLFYAFLASVAGPVLFYYLGGKTYKSAGYGFIFFSVINIILWFNYGQKMV